MSEGKNERVVREFYKLFVKRDFDGLQELLTPDFKWIGSSNREWDFQKLRDSGMKDTGAFPDLKLDIRRVLTQGNARLHYHIFVGSTVNNR